MKAHLSSEAERVLRRRRKKKKCHWNTDVEPAHTKCQKTLRFTACFFFFLYRCCINQRLFPPSCKYDELNRSPAPTGRVGRTTTSDATGGVISLLWLSTDDREPRFTPGARWGRIERRRLQRVRFSEPTWDDRRGLWGEGGGGKPR